MKIKLPSPIIKTFNILESAGFKGFIVGGCIRDYLLDVEPKDFDMTTNATPIEMMNCFKAFTIIETGIKHGTITVIIDGMPIEITTHRIESTYSDQRHPDKVCFTNDIKDDLKRRDFTINAMAYHPKEGVIDPYHGQEDLNKKLIRCVGNPQKRFNEDPLRILRGVRFASVLGFKIEKNTINAMDQKKEQLENISAERIGSEMKKLICGKNIKQVINDYDLILGVVVPELLEKDMNKRFLKSKENQMRFEMQLALDLAPKNVVLRYTLLFYYIERRLDSKEIVEIAKKRLVALREDKKTILQISHLLSTINKPIKKNKSDIKRWLNYLSEPLFLKLLEIKRILLLVQIPIDQNKLVQYDQIKVIVYQIIRNKECYLRRQLNINGKDLIAIDIKSGKKIGQILDYLLEAVINEEIENKREQLLKESAGDNAMLIDTHAHIDDEKFDIDREEVLKNAKENGIDFIINPGEDEESSRRAVALAEKNDMIYAAVGFHPHDAKAYDIKIHGELLRQWSKKEKVVAIGEIGLDYHYDLSPRDIQQRVLIEQMKIAKEVALPIVIHNRESMEDMVRILKENFTPEYGGIMHSYSGSVEMAKIFLDMGFYLSVSGTLTFKNARKLPEVVAMMPLDRLLIETDSPYLTPTPNRGKRNEPQYVRYVATSIASIRGVKEEMIWDVTSENAKRVFNLK